MTKLSVRLMGGLGNQLFEIFTVIAHALRNGMEFTFQNCTSLPIGTVRPTYWGSLLDGLQTFLIPKYTIDKYQTYAEPDYTYNVLPVFTENTALCGYFQSVKYFQDELPLILELLNIKEKISAMKKRFTDIFSSSICMMHFRITGYKHISDYHPIASYEYYTWALRRLNPARVLFFHQPEDEAEVLEMINRISADFPGIIFIQAPQFLADWEQMLLMACCDQHIIANSSFSWWGAVLAGNDNAVTYPANWFGPKATHNIKDMVLPSWIPG